MCNENIYSASYTGAALMYSEMTAIIPHLLEDSSPEAIHTIAKDPNIVMIHSSQSRARVVSEFVKRFKAAPESFWNRYLTLPEEERRMALFYAIVKAYRLVFDFQTEVTVPKYESAVPKLESIDLMMKLGEIAGRNDAVDAWSDSTKKMAVSKYLTILRQVGFLQENGELKKLDVNIDAYRYYLEIGEDWFLRACFLRTYEVNNIKQNI